MRDALVAGTVRAAVGCTVLSRCLQAATGLVLCLMLAGGMALAQRAAPDDFAVALAAIEQYFGTLRDYQPGDLITQSQVADALAAAEDAGAKVPDAEGIVELALPDNSFLARELSTPAGRKFMRKVSRHPGGFSRLDRLSSISRGQTIVRDLVRNADGDKFIKYLATTRGGRKLGRALAGAQQGADLNKPTGRIYTADDLFAELEVAFAVQTGSGPK